MKALAGVANRSEYFYIVGDAGHATPGEPITGLLYSDIETGGSASYARQGAARVDLTLITLASASAAHSDGGFILVDDTNMPGLYRCDFPDAAYATGVSQVTCQIVIASAKNAVAAPITIEIDDNVVQTGDSYLGATAHGNLVNQYDGDGISGDNFPAKQSQIDGIANVGSASHKQITAEDLTTPATTTGGSFTDIQQLDGVYMYWDAVSGGFEAEFTTNIGSGTPSGIKLTGHLQGNGDNLRLQMWDFQIATPIWKTVETWEGRGSAADVVLPADAFIGYVGIGANKGDIRIRLYNDNGTDDVALTAANIYIDQMFVEFSPSASSTLDRIYFDSNAANTNTVPGQDGIPGNPVSTMTAVNTLLVATGLHRVEVESGATATLAAAQSDQVFSGENWTLALGAQDISGSAFIGAVVSGIAGGIGTQQTFRKCHMNAVTHIKNTHILESGIAGTQTAGEAGDYHFDRGHSSIAGIATWIFDFGAAISDTNLNVRNYSGGIQLENMGNAGTDTASIEGRGQIIEGTCAGGVVAVRGLFTTSGITNLTLSDDARFARAQVATDTVDEWEAQSQANPSGFQVNLMEIDSNANIMKKLKEFVDANVLFSDTAQAGGAATITLAAGTSITDNDLQDFAIYLNGGLGAGQFARINSVVAATQVATIKTPINGWETDPDGTTTYIILSAGSIIHVSEIHQAALTQITTELDTNSTFASEVTNIQTQVGVAGDGLIDLGGMSTTMKAEILAEVVKLATTQLTESYAADGVAPTWAEALFQIMQFLHEPTYSGVTLTVKKLDGTTAAMTFTMDDATNPTTNTRTT